MIARLTRLGSPLFFVVACLAASCSKDKDTTPTTPTCSFSVTQPTTTFGPDGGSGSASVTAASGCSWTATSSASFITISQGASGSGNGTVQFSVAANTGAERTATLAIAGTNFTVTQRAMATPPAGTLSAPNPKSPIGGATVSAGRRELVVDNATSTGTIGTVTYRFEISDTDSFPSDPARTSTQDGVAQGSGTTTWVTGDLAPGVTWFWRARATDGTVTSAYSNVERFRTAVPSCTYTLSPTTATVVAAGGTSIITVTTGSTCAWTAVSNTSFITVMSGGSGTGNGTVTFTTAANTGAARTGTMTIAGQTVTVNQEAAAGAPPSALVASFQLFDPSSQSGATTECRFRSATTAPTTCTLQSTSVALGSNVIVTYTWSVQYTYGSVKTITQSGPSSTLSLTDTCGGTTSTADGVAQPLAVTLTVTDNLGATATATSGSGSQPALQVRLYTCGS